MARELASSYIGFQKQHSSSAAGAVMLDRPLSLRELRRYRMRPIKMPRVIHDMYGVRRDGSKEFLLTLERPFVGYIPARMRAKETRRSRKYVDYIASPRNVR